MFRLEWNDRAKSIVAGFRNSKPYWQEFLEQSSYRLGEKGVEYIKEKDFLKASAPWFGIVKGTGKLQDSLKFEVSSDGEGFTTTFSSLFYGNYIDQGNGTSRITPKSAGKLAVRSRFGTEETMLMDSVAPMGQSSYSGWKPKEFTVKTMEYLNENTPSLVERYLQEALDKLVKV